MKTANSEVEGGGRWSNVYWFKKEELTGDHSIERPWKPKESMPEEESAGTQWAALGEGDKACWGTGTVMVAGASAHISSSKKGAVKEKKIRDMQSGVEVGRKGGTK